ncbi:hypothetical protein Lacal_0126 [Lacinutrix sp. 5H-3-7-4]|nr:hypothetical protein Lacal_0126 [Lacinutrix sp. 5H-3-7-4]
MRIFTLCIDTTQAAQILGKSQSSACSLFRSIRDARNKRKGQSISIREFCEYTDLPYDDVFNMINLPSKSA